MTTVTPIARPPAIRNCGDARRAKTAGEDVLSAVRIEGDIRLKILDSSASVRATAAIASGFDWRFLMMVVAECCRQCASRRRVSSLDIVAASSISLSAVSRRRTSGGIEP